MAVHEARVPASYAFLKMREHMYGDPFEFEFDGQLRRLGNVTQMHEKLRHLVASTPGKTAIVAGCYFVVYAREQERLVPLIPEELTGTPLADLSERLGGPFPLKTFRMGFDLAKSSNVRIALLVNDRRISHGVKSSTAHDADLGQLRRNYFRRPAAENIPKVYQEEIKKSGLGLGEAFILHERKKASKVDILPQRSHLFSEKFLANQFYDKRSHQIAENEQFAIKTEPGGQRSLHYFSRIRNHGEDSAGLCLSHGQCGCTALMLEFFFVLNEMQFESVILLVPDECHGEVNTAAEAAVAAIKMQLRIAVVTGLGGSAPGPPRNEIFIWSFGWPKNQELSQ